MPNNFAVFFAGSGQKVEKSKFVYSGWGEELFLQGYTPLFYDGVGKERGTNEITGAGWAKIVQKAMTAVEKGGGAPDRVIVVGMSRGGVQALIFAHCMRHKFPTAKLFVFAVDPVQGGSMLNAGSFDLRNNRWGRSLGLRGSRDKLKDRYHLADSAPNTVPENVEFYLTALMQFRGKSREFLRWGFTPQAPTLNNIKGLRNHRYATYEIPGDHGYGVYTGAQKGAEEVHAGRYARGRVTREMFAKHCRDHGFGHVEFDNPIVTLNQYCRIANEDLRGNQGQDKDTGYSFLKASRQARAFGSPFNNPAAAYGWEKGRGHMVACTQAIQGKGYFVNARHRELYKFCRPVIEDCIQHKRNELFSRNDQIVDWLAHNAKFATHAERDSVRFRVFMEQLESF